MKLYFYISIIVLFIVFFITKKIKNKKIIISVNFIITLVYFFWRIQTIPSSGIISIIFSVLLLLAEIIGLIQSFNMQLIFSKKYKLEKKQLNLFDSLPTIDIFICTYNESKELLEKTILAAKNLDYEKSKYKIYVCDDGNRVEIKQLCDNTGINYITRQSNENAKAGNLNNALLLTQGELFVVLDADMICTKNFLENTVGYFIDPEVCFVQTPQVYYNKDMYQHNMKKNDIPNEQDFFMRDIQEGRAAYNAVLHVGTNAIFRRKHVIECGMYPTNSITEDMALGMLLQSKGYKSVFVNEILVLGMSATNYSDLAIQRDRWCRGNIQVFKHFNPLFNKGLTFMQKLLYFDGIVYWFSSFQKLIYVLCPLLYLFTGIRCLDASAKEVICFFIPYLISLILTFKTIAPDTRSLLWAHFYEIAMFPHICLAILKELFSLKTSFIVTPKEQRNDKSYFQLNVILPHIILSLLTVSGWLLCSYYLSIGFLTISPVIINYIWSFYNFIAFVVCIKVAYQLSENELDHYSTLPNEIEINIKTDNNK